MIVNCPKCGVEMSKDECRDVFFCWLCGHVIEMVRLYANQLVRAA